MYGQTLLLLFLISFVVVEHSSAQQAYINWTPSEDAEVVSYNIYRATHLDSEFLFLGTVPATDSSYIDNSIHANSTYYYAATSIDVYGRESGYSNIYTLEPSASTPVELAIFTATSQDRCIMLEWSTKSESNNYGFEIERSENGDDFTVIGFVAGSGTSANPNLYQYIDEDVATGRYYYRLRQVDLNNTHTYSQTIDIAVQAPESFSLRPNYPNPFNPSTTISYTLPHAGHVELMVYNTQGELVKRMVDDFQEAGFHSVLWHGDDGAGFKVPSGIYYCRLKSTAGVQTRRMTLLK